MTGYSGTPLAKKLSLKPGQRAWFCNMPDSVRAEIHRGAPLLELLATPEPPIDAAHLFVTERAVLDCELRLLLPLLDSAGFIWVSWPKKASKVATDITEDVIREIALPIIRHAQRKLRVKMRRVLGQNRTQLRNGRGEVALAEIKHRVVVLWLKGHLRPLITLMHDGVGAQGGARRSPPQRVRMQRGLGTN